MSQSDIAGFIARLKPALFLFGVGPMVAPFESSEACFVDWDTNLLNVSCYACRSRYHAQNKSPESLSGLVGL